MVTTEEPKTKIIAIILKNQTTIWFCHAGCKRYYICFPAEESERVSSLMSMWIDDYIRAM